MPGICGIACHEPFPDLAEQSAEMVRRLKHHPWYREDRHADAAAGVALGRASLGFVNAAEQPARNEDGSLLAVMEGELYDADELRRTLADAGHRFRGDGHAEVLLHGYESAGQDFFGGLNGTFAAAIWDAAGRRLVLVNDRFGMKPLYYAEAAGRLLFGSEIKALLADPDLPRARSRRGLAQFFTFGQLLGEDTLFEAVRVLPAAGWLTYEADRGRLRSGRYPRPEAPRAEARLTEADHLDRIDAAFKRAVDRRAGGTRALGLALSGGLDARTILGAIDHADVPLTTVSMGMEGSIDLASAAAMAARTNRRHHSFLLGSGFLADFEAHLRRMVHLTDGHFLSQCIVMPTLPAYRDWGVEVLLRGHAGELMHMDKAYNFSLDRAALALRDEAGLEAWLWGRMRAFVSGPDDVPLFVGPPGEMEGLARDSLRACLGESAGTEPAPHRIWHLFVAQRLRRETAMSLAKFGSVVETRLPYLDNDLVEALMAAPPGLKVGDRIQRHILRRRMPAFLDVVNANTGARLGAGRLERLAARVRLKVLAKLGVRGYQPYERLGLWLRRELRPLVRGLLLADECLGRGVFRPEAVRAVVDGHLEGKRNHTFLILALMSFECGQREEWAAERRYADCARG